MVPAWVGSSRNENPVSTMSHSGKSTIARYAAVMPVVGASRSSRHGMPRLLAQGDGGRPVGHGDETEVLGPGGGPHLGDAVHAHRLDHEVETLAVAVEEELRGGVIRFHTTTSTRPP